MENSFEYRSTSIVIPAWATGLQNQMKKNWAEF